MFHSGHFGLIPVRPFDNVMIMTATAFLDLKQRATTLSESERRQLSAFLLRLGQDRPEWKRESARRMKEMAAGKKISVADLRKKLRHA